MRSLMILAALAVACLAVACGDDGPSGKTTTTKAPEARAPGPDGIIPPLPAEDAPKPSPRETVDEAFANIDNFFDSQQQRRAYLQIDKPIYKPGETIWLRVWDLQARDLASVSNMRGQVELIDPKGAAVVRQSYALDDGLLSANLDLGDDINGGEFTLRYIGRGPPVERPVIVSRYEPPRLKKKLEFTRKAYGENDVVKATFELKRTTGEPLANHPVTALLRLDGEELPRVSVTTNKDGGALVEVPLPSSIAVGDGLLTVLVEDGGVTESISKAVPIIMKRMQLSFFPEGGALVTGLPSRVYFEAKTPIGKPADVSGEIVDDQGQVVSAFESYKEGLGRFVLSPAVGRTYSARITKPEGIIDTIILPQAQDEGCVLRTYDDLDGARAELVASVVCTADQTVTVVGTVRDNVIDKGGLKVKRGKPSVIALTSKDANKNAMGVMRVTVFNADKTPVAERIVFRNRRARMNVSVKPLKEKHAPRDQVALQIKTTSPDGSPVSADLALSVVDDTVVSFADDKTGHMLSRLYLEPELPSKVEEPNLFFDLKDDKSALALELLMGTRGYRRFEWQPALSFVERQTVAKSRNKRGEKMDEMAGGGAPRPAAPAMVANEAMDLDAAPPPKGALLPPMAEKKMALKPQAAPRMALAAAPPPPPRDQALNMGKAKEEVADKRVEREAPIMQGVGALGDRARRFDDDAGIGFAEARRHRPNPNAAQFAVARVFPAPNYGGPPPSVRTDFRETIHWAPRVKTGGDGTSVVTFYLSDAVTSFRVFTEGTGGGVAGRDETVFDSKLPFSMAVKLPLEVSAGDVIEAPLMLTNEQSEAIDVDVKGTFGALVTVKGDRGATKNLQQGGRDSMIYALDVTGMKGDTEIAFSAEGSGLKDEFVRTLRVVPRGFPIERSYSGNLKDKVSHTIDTGAAVKGTLDGEVRVYPSPTSTLIAGLEGMLRQPSGCFEQTSSTNYPNVMIATYLDRNNVIAPEVAARAQQLMDSGYKKLVGFETKEKGYEWFGGAPGHEALTAYGLLEFIDMKAVYGGVDDAMITRTAEWLKKRRDGKGGYTRNPRALDSFGGATPEVTNAYITWALSEAKTKDIATEVNAQAAVATSTTDAYILALAANTLWNAGQADKAQAATTKLAAMQDESGAFTKAQQSITRSGGQNLHLETTALAVLALLKAGNTAAAGKAIEWMMKNRGMYGQWGATQATVLSLKAFIAYLEATKKTQAPGTVIVKANGVVHKTVNYEAGHKEPIVIDGLSALLTAGQNDVTILLDGADALPYTLGVTFRSTVPASDPEAAVDLKVSADKASVKMGEPVRVTAVVTNKTQAGQPMTLARVGIPGGLVSQDWQLKKLREEGKIAFYETRAREVILYFRDLAPSAVHSIPIDLVAQVPGTYEAPASSAYLYYTDDKKTWASPLGVTVTQ